MVKNPSVYFAGGKKPMAKLLHFEGNFKRRSKSVSVLKSGGVGAKPDNEKVDVSKMNFESNPTILFRNRMRRYSKSGLWRTVSMKFK